MKDRTRIAVALAALLSSATARAQFSHPGCDDLKPEDFAATELFNRTGVGSPKVQDNSLTEPIQMDLVPVHSGGRYSHADIYFVERRGKVKYFNGASNSISVMGTIPVSAAQTSAGVVNDNGLMGVAAHPDFSRNRWLYFWYSPTTSTPNTRFNRLRLSRFTVTTQNTLDMASEKVLIDILGVGYGQGAVHSGGPMTFDKHGDLWVTIGKNAVDLNQSTCSVVDRNDSIKSSEWGASSTASMRGGVIRIHPDSSGKGYSIPRGNFGEYWADRFAQQGRTTLAAQYRDTAKVLPEVYIKGSRSNFSISVHPTKRWVTTGVVNYASHLDELNLAAHPMFHGYPYFHGNKEKTCPDRPFNAEVPTNTSPFNRGVTELPPVEGGTIVGQGPIIITGPIYVFDSSLASQTKFPPHFNENWITLDFKSNAALLSKIDPGKVNVTATRKIDTGYFKLVKGNIRNPIQGKYGPDGSLYILNFDGWYGEARNPGITRLDYKGSCRIPVGISRPEPKGDVSEVLLLTDRLVIQESGPHVFSLHTVSGKTLHRKSGRDWAEYGWDDIPGLRLLDGGVYYLNVKTPKGSLHRKVFLSGAGSR